MDGWSGNYSGLSTIDRKWANRNETTHKGRLLENGKSSTIICRVRNEGVSMTVDGKLIFDWKGKYVRLGNIPSLSVPHKDAMYLNAFNCRYRFRKMILHPISGRGRKLKSPEILSPNEVENRMKAATAKKTQGTVLLMTLVRTFGNLPDDQAALKSLLKKSQTAIRLFSEANGIYASVRHKTLNPRELIAERTKSDQAIAYLVTYARKLEAMIEK